MFDSRDARVHCSLSKYTLLIDHGRDHAKIKIQHMSVECHSDNYEGIIWLADIVTVTTLKKCVTYCTRNFMQTEPLHVYNIFVSNIFIIILFRDHKYLLFFDITTCVTKGGDLTKYVSISSCPTPQVLPVDHLYQLMFCLHNIIPNVIPQKVHVSISQNHIDKYSLY